MKITIEEKAKYPEWYVYTIKFDTTIPVQLLNRVILK